MMRRAFAGAVAGALFLVACSVANSLDYLTSGGPPTADGGDAAPRVPPTAVATGRSQPGAHGALIVDATSLTWVEGATGAIMSIAKDAVAANGAVPKQIATAQKNDTVTLAADAAGDVYWVGETEGALHRVARGGTDTKLSTGDTRPAAVAVDGTFVYWGDRGSEDGTITGQVLKQPKAGGAKTVVFDDGTAEPTALVVDDTNLLVADFSGGVTVLPKAAVDAGTGATIDTDSVGIEGTFGFAADATAIYFLDTTSATIERVLRSAGAPPAKIVTETKGAPVALAIDATHVYWTNTSAGTVSRIAKGGGTPEVIADAQPGPFALAVDDAFVYWTNIATGAADGAVVRLPKPR